MNDVVKICRVHGELKKEDVVGKKRFDCKRCNRKSIDNYRKNNKEKINLHKRIKYKNDEYHRKILSAKVKKYYNENIDRIRKYKKEWQQKNNYKYKSQIDLDIARKKSAIYYKNNKDRIIKQSREWFNKNKNTTKFKERKKLSSKKYNEKIKESFSDEYVKKMIIGSSKIIKRQHIKKEFIELKRIQIMLKRKSKELLNGNRKQ